MRNLFTLTKRRKTRLLHTGYRYEGSLLKNNIDSYFLANKHVKYIVNKIDLILVGLSNSIENLENFFNIAVDKVEDYQPTRKVAPITITKTGYSLSVKLINRVYPTTADISFIDNNGQSEKYYKLSSVFTTFSTYLSQTKYTIFATLKNSNTLSIESIIEKINGDNVDGTGSWNVVNVDSSTVTMSKTFNAGSRIPDITIVTSD